jgi:peptide deformylase
MTMTVLQVPLYGEPILREAAQAVGRHVPLDGLLEQMRIVQQHFKHPCIAAKLVGVNVRVLLINTSFDRNRSVDEHFTAVMVNPEVISRHNPLLAGLESDPCIPNYQGSVERHRSIQVSWTDEQSRPQTALLSESPARWVQHGVEMLEGKLFIDNLNAHRLRSIKAHLKHVGVKSMEEK